MEIILKNVTYNDTIKNINLNIEKGITGIIGKNGSGKSLLLKLIANIIEPTEGSIDINKNFGYTDCNNNLIVNNTIYEYLKETLMIKKYHLQEIGKRIQDVLIMVGLENTAHKKVINLSKSEKIKLNIASILIYNPKILIIDEPFITLDNNDIKKIIKIFRLLKIRYNKTVIIATNKVDILHKIVDNVCIIDSGKLIICKNKYDVFKDTNLLKKYGLQAPNVVSFSSTVLNKKNIKMGYRDEINDLIKDIYRYVK